MHKQGSRDNSHGCDPRIGFHGMKRRGTNAACAMRRRFAIMCRSFRVMSYLLVLTSCVSCTTNSSESLQPSDETPAGDSQVSKVQGADQVLRHAVFFQFKESSTEEQVREVVDAFRALPSQIDAIVDFQWGTNNSPEGLDDGFTHCFLLTFENEEGRAIYLPHEAHKAFGNVLRPHMQKVFVIDYWGMRETPLEKELKHAVFFKFKEDASSEDVRAVEDAFAALPSKIEAIKAFEWGRNNSPEKRDHGFTHCFMVTFDSEDGRSSYLPHADHQAFVEILKPVLDKVRVLDFWAEK